LRNSKQLSVAKCPALRGKVSSEHRNIANKRVAGQTAEYRDDLSAADFFMDASPKKMVDGSGLDDPARQTMVLASLKRSQSNTLSEERLPTPG